MHSNRLAGLKLMVTGLSAAACREVICSLLAAGAEVACAGDEADTAQLQRDLGLYGLTVRALPIDLGSASEVRLFAANLQVLKDLPHIIVCCCAGGEECPSSVLSGHLSPPLYLHLITRDCGPVIERLLDLGTRDLQSIIRRRLIFSRGAPIRRAMIGRNAFALERGRGHGRPATRRSRSAPRRSSRYGRSHAAIPPGGPHPRSETME
jgi:hypothetical protein